MEFLSLIKCCLFPKIARLLAYCVAFSLIRCLKIPLYFYLISVEIDILLLLIYFGISDEEFRFRK